MGFKSDSDLNPQAETADHESGDEGRQPPGELPPGANALQPAPPPPANSPPNQEHEDRRENVKLGLEIFGLAALIVYTVFSVLQWAQIRWTNRLTREALNGSDSALRQTLEKMQFQINQMSRLADNAGRQADRTQDLANRTQDQARASQKTANAAKSAADTAARQLEIAQRPWLSIVPKIAGPLAFDKTGVHATVQVMTHNFGQSPAINSSSIGVKLEMVKGTNVTTKVSNVKEFCKTLMEPATFLEGSVFPGKDRQSGGTVVQIERSELDSRKKFGIQDLDDLIDFEVVICVPYQSTFNAAKWYYTAEIYDLLHTIPGSDPSRTFKMEETVPPTELRLGYSIWPEIAR